jgi:hypothetical protein
VEEVAQDKEGEEKEEEVAVVVGQQEAQVGHRSSLVSTSSSKRSRRCRPKKAQYC